MRFLLAGLLLLLASLGQAQGLPAGDRGGFGSALTEPQFLPVEEAYQLEIEILERGDLRLYWQIAEGYYLYQHRFNFTLEDHNGQTVALDLELPPALERSDEFFGEVRVYYHQADVVLRPGQPPTGELATLSVGSQGCADAGLCYPPQTQLFRLDYASGTATPLKPAVARAKAQPAGGTETAPRGLLYMVALAFVGGAILNLMPCVFPILSLKVLSFARSSDHDRHLHSWLYTAGVISSFVLVAAVLIALQQAGRAVGWGFQLQSPGFVIALAYLFVAMGLSLSGLFQFGGSLMNLGSGLAARGGWSGSYFTGVLAVVVASPCTAPFMGTALGFAATQPAQVALLVFASLGAGMAAPLLLFSYSGASRRLMPAPGPWMETLKQLLAFPLYGTAIWLLWVAGRQTGVNTMGMALAGILLMTLGLWTWHRGGAARALSVLCLLAAAVLGSWRGAGESESHTPLTGGKVAWSEQRLADMRAAGRPVFVDVTADWCITCIANETAVLDTDDIIGAFERLGVVYMVADWTNYNPAIARFLERHGRSGIPLYLIYPADPGAEPLVLPQLLSKNTVLDALKGISVENRDLADSISEDSRLKPTF
jgi:thiol:disulfide interchange protein DsbD